MALATQALELRIEPAETVLGRMLEAGMFASHDCQRGIDAPRDVSREVRASGRQPPDARRRPCRRGLW